MGNVKDVLMVPELHNAELISKITIYPQIMGQVTAYIESNMLIIVDIMMLMKNYYEY